jgi:hypothetical protein
VIPVYRLLSDDTGATLLRPTGPGLMAHLTEISVTQKRLYQTEKALSKRKRAVKR